MSMWCSRSCGTESQPGGFLSHRHTRCLTPWSSRYWYSDVLLGSASPATLSGSTQEKLCGGVEAMFRQIRMSQWLRTAGGSRTHVSHFDTEPLPMSHVDGHVGQSVSPPAGGPVMTNTSTVTSRRPRSRWLTGGAIDPEIATGPWEGLRDSPLGDTMQPQCGQILE